MFQVKLNDRFKQFFGSENERRDLERKDHIMTTNRHLTQKSPYSRGVLINSTFITGLSGKKEKPRKLGSSIEDIYRINTIQDVETNSID